MTSRRVNPAKCNGSEDWDGAPMEMPANTGLNCQVGTNEDCYHGSKLIFERG